MKSLKKEKIFLWIVCDKKETKVMENNKTLKYTIIPVALLIVVYNICFFILTDLYTSSKWIVYVFTMLALTLQIGLSCWIKNIDEKEVSLSSVIYISGFVYIAFQIVIEKLLMYIPNVKITFVIELVACAVFLILLVGMGLSKNIMGQTEEMYQNNTVFIRNMHIRVTQLKLHINDSKFVKELEKLEDALKYSDPVSNVKLQEIELQLEESIKKIEIAAESNPDNIYWLISQTLKLLEERNNICKLIK